MKGLKLADVQGHALMIHAGGDNYSDTPKPLGGGGDRIVAASSDSDREGRGPAASLRIAGLGAFLKLGRPLFLGGGVVMYGLGVAAAVAGGARFDWTRYWWGQLIVSATSSRPTTRTTTSTSKPIAPTDAHALVGRESGSADGGCPPGSRSALRWR